VKTFPIVQEPYSVFWAGIEILIHDRPSFDAVGQCEEKRIANKLSIAAGSIKDTVDYH